MRGRFMLASLLVALLGITLPLPADLNRDNWINDNGDALLIEPSGHAFATSAAKVGAQSLIQLKRVDVVPRVAGDVTDRPRRGDADLAQLTPAPTPAPSDRLRPLERDVPGDDPTLPVPWRESSLQSAPQPNPQPTPQPEPRAAPQPAPQPVPQPEPQPAPQPAPQPGGRNPLDVPRAEPAAADPFVGTFSNERITLELAAVEGGYSGTITMGANRYPAVARKQNDKLVGLFRADQDQYEWQLTLTELGATLRTGNTEYALRRAGAAPPGPGGPAEIIGRQPGQEGKVLLQQKFAPGNYAVEVVSDTETSGTQIIRNATSTQVSMQIGTATMDGRIPVRMVIVRMRSVTEAAGIRMEFDTANPQASNEPMAVAMAGLTNQPFDLLLRPSGHVDEIRGIDEAIRRASQGNEAAGVMLFGMKEQVRLGLEQVLMGNVGRMLSERPVGPGDTWNAKLRIHPPGMPETEIDGKARLESLDGAVARVHFEGRSPTNAQLPPGYAVEFQLAADFIIDVRSGMVMGGAGQSTFHTVTPSGQTKAVTKTGVTVTRQ